MEYTPDHQIHLKIPTTAPEQITEKLQEVGFLLAPIGDVLSLKACDFATVKRLIQYHMQRKYKKN